MLLAIDTSTRVASIALFDRRVLVETTWIAGAEHSRQLLPQIDTALSTLGKTVADVTAIGVAIGPGSFNGLRVGVATAKAICLGRGIPIVGIETLRATAYAFRLTNRPTRPLYDAGRGEVATGLYQASGDLFATLEEPRITSLDGALADSPCETIFCGELRPEWTARIEERRAGSEAPSVLVPNGAEEPRRAGYLAELAWQLVNAGIVDDVATLQPLYLRRPPVSGVAAGSIGGSVG